MPSQSQSVPVRRIAPILGILGALGPLSIDMYLPGLPQIAARLGASESQMQFSLMACFVGLMVGQLFYGPLSDRTGRKPMTYVGLAIFIVASIGCAVSTTAAQLIAWRFAEGVGGSIGIVIGIAMIRDIFTGKTAASLVALVMAVLGVAPVIAPIIGTAVMSVAPWPVLFLLLAAFGAITLVLFALFLPESRLEELRRHSDPLKALHNYAHLLTSRKYISYVAALAVAQAGFFAYLSASAFVFISIHGVSPVQYSLIFAVNAVGFVLGIQLAPRLLGRFRAQTIMRAALLVYVVAAVVMALLEFNGGIGLLPLSALLFVSITALAFVIPLNSMLALESYGAISGTAAALMNSCQYGGGALASLIVGAMANGSAQPMTATIACCAVGGCLIAFFLCPRHAPAHAAAA